MSERTPVGPVAWVTTAADQENLIEVLQTAEAVVFDLETTGLEEHAVTGGQANGGVAARIVLASYTLPLPGGGEPTTYVVPLSHPDSPFLGTWKKVMTEHARAIVEAERPVIGHNVKFDCRWVFAHTGIDLSARVAGGWDTRISSHLLDENASTRLKERAPDTFGVERWDDFDLTYPGAAEDVALFDLGEYAARDTYWTWRLYEEHRRRLYLSGAEVEPESPEEVTEARLGRVAVWVSMPTTSSLTRIEQRGLRMDIEWVKEELAQDTETNAALTQQIADRYPMTEFDRRQVSTAPTSKWFKAWTEAAVEAGDLRVAALTPNGAPQWSKAVLTRQAHAGSEAAQLVLDVRHHSKRAEYLRSWLTLVSPDGMIHANYNAGSVLTGRLSSSSPNMQQITKALRPAFIPREGYVLADIDYSQIELRVSAFISRCQPMIEAFQRGEDLHTLLASHITGKPLGEVTPQERQAGKSANFGLLYGMGALGFREYAEVAYGVSVSEEAAQEIHEGFFTLWDGMRDWHNRVIRRVHQTGYVTSPIGRVRRLPGIWDGNPQMVSFAERAAINSPVQGFASDLMQMAAASIQGLLPGSEPVPGAFPVATVHDSIVVEVRQEGWEETVKECIDRMLNLHPVLQRMDCHLDVPLAAEATCGTRWGLDDLGVI